MTNQEECLQHLAQMKEHDWKRMEDLLSDIHAATSFGEWQGGNQTDDGSYVMPYLQASEIVLRFIRLMHDLQLSADFDWTSWTDGRRMLERRDWHNEDIDAWTACRLITTMIRSDRFVEGSLAGFFQKGHVSAALAALLSAYKGGRLVSTQTP